MALHNELGKEGEELAVKWLREKGFTILQCNWRYSYYEIDIIATKIHTHEKAGPKEFLHFVEVKARMASPFGNPEDSVTKKKFKHLQKAADEYLFRNPGYAWIQHDILSITLHRNKDVDYFLIEDVFL
jgi:putative endonuclease